MSLPVGISTCTVTFGGAVSYRGEEAVSVTGTLSADRDVVWAATGTGVYSADEILPDQAGSLSFVVPHVDQSGFTDGSGNTTTNWFYILLAEVRFASGRRIPVRKRFQVFVGETTKDLDLVGDGPIIPGVTIPNAGITRADVATDIADPESLIGEALSATFALIEPTTGWRYFKPDTGLFLDLNRTGNTVRYRLNGTSALGSIANLFPAGFSPPASALGSGSAAHALAYYDLNDGVFTNVGVYPDGTAVVTAGGSAFGQIEGVSGEFEVSSTFPSTPFPGSATPLP